MSNMPELTYLKENGRIVIPVKLRRRLGFKPGMSLHLTADNERLVVSRPQKTWEKLQATLKPYRAKKGAKRASDQLIAARRREAKQEGL